MNTHSPDIRKIYNTLFLILLLGASFWVLSKSKIDDIENNLYGKEFLISNFNRLRIKLGDRVFHNVLRGENGWLEYSGEHNLDDFQNLTGSTPNELQAIERKLVNLDQKLRSQNITLLILVAPNKATIYPENIPEKIQRNPGPSRLDQFSNLMTQHPGILYLDIRAELINAKEKQRLYYKTDTHWNPYGAYIAYAEIMKKLSSRHPELDPYPIKKFDFTEQTPTSQDLANIMGAPFWTESRIKIKFRSQYSPSEKTIMIYGDSFSGALIPFLELNFSQSSYTHWNEKINLQQIQKNHPDIVVIQVVERYLLSLNLVLPNE